MTSCRSCQTLFMEPGVITIFEKRIKKCSEYMTVTKLAVALVDIASDANGEV